MRSLITPRLLHYRSDIKRTEGIVFSASLSA